MQYADALTGLVELEEVYLALPEFVLPYPSAYNQTSLDTESFSRAVLERNTSLKIIGVECFVGYNEAYETGAELWWRAMRVQRTQGGDIALRHICTDIVMPRARWDKPCFR
jgi:hypothetical protein